jgi:glycerol dehydrogenase-like iron-containing ADH family enzyme
MHGEDVALAMLLMRRLDRDAAGDELIVKMVQLLHAFANAGLDCV